MCFIVQRVFNSVGQGGFYEERFSSLKDGNFFNFVYDCGTDNGQSLFAEILSSKDYSTIDLMCISHFDNDHVSLLPALLKGKSIETLILPQVTDEIIYSILFKIGSHSAVDKSDSDFDNMLNRQSLLLSDPREFIRSVDGKVERIIYIKQEKEKRSFEANQLQFIEELPKEVVLPSGSELSSGKFIQKWIFKPVNISFMKGSMKDDFIKALSEILADEYKDKYATVDMNFIKDVICDKKLIRIIRKAYHVIYRSGNISKKMNDYSMALYSGLPYDETVTRTRIFLPKRCVNGYLSLNCLRLHCAYCQHGLCGEDEIDIPVICVNQIYSGRQLKAGCLYLGDYDANNDEYYRILEYFYRNYKEKLIYSIQIPHHGSKENWNDKLLEWAESFIVSYGSNRHGHPASEVLFSVLNSGKALFEITHLSHSALVYLIEVYAEPDNNTDNK